MKKLLLFFALFFTGLGVSAQCNYNVELWDSWGDGWGGGTLDILVNGVSIGAPVTFTTGQSAEFPISVSTGDIISFVYTPPFQYASENAWQLTDADGVIVHTEGSSYGLGPNDGGIAPPGNGGSYTVTCPACATPTNAPVSGLSSTGATLNWTSTETAFDVEWGLSGFVPTGLPSAGYDDVPSGVGLTGLTSSTTYDYYLRTDCAAGGGSGQSIWVGPFSFTTLCLPDIAPYIESFDGPSLDVCASLSAVAGGPWGLGINYTWNNACAAPTDHTGNGGSFISNDMSTPDAGVVYQLNDVDVNALTTPYLDMYHYMCGPYNNEVYVEAWDGTAWVQVGLINTGSPNWENYGFDLTGFTFAANLVRIRFRLEEGSTGTGSQFQSDVALDDISIIEAPSCFAPTSLAAGLVSTSEVVLSWTSAETVFDVALGVAPLAAPVAGDSVGVGNNLTVTGLTPNTTYEYYVRADCGAGGGSGQSTWAGPFSFFTGYCQVSTSNTGDYLSAISTTGANTNVNYTAGAQPPNSYADETSQVIESFPGGFFDFSTTYVGGSNGVNIWVDLNNDLDFDDVGELVFSQANTAATKTGVINIPISLPLGSYRVRVRGQFGSTANPPACGNVAWGSTVDFTLSIVPPPACPAPTALAAGVTSSSATLSWTNAETVFDVAVGVAPLAAPVAGDSVGVGNNLTVTGLTPNTTYEYYVRADCAAGGGTGQSTWAGPFSFTTLCNSISAFPFVETFETTSTTESCWTVLNENGDSDEWTLDGTNNGNNNSGTESAEINTDFNSGANDDYLVSPGFILTGSERLRYFVSNESSSEPNDYEVLVSSNGLNVASFTDTLLIDTVDIGDDGAMEEIILDLSPYTGEVFIAFHIPNGGLDGWRLFIDDVTIEAIPPCFNDTIPVVACDSIMLAGAMQTVSGLYTDSLTSVTGCDSIVTFDLTINSTIFETVDFTDCDSIEVLGTWYFASTSFNDTIVGGAANGCDSITTFNLTLNSSSVGSVDTTICDDESLILPDGAVVTAAGTYTSVLVGANGCDSVVTTELSVIMCTTGVEGIEGIETLSIYPNPYISTINLLFDDAVAGELNITLFDVTGRVLKAESVMTAIGANTISINVSPEVAAGVHILQIERDGAVYSTSIIKK